MNIFVDARGLACPQPVILTRNALEREGAAHVLVDNETSAYNVTRMAEKLGCTVRKETREDGIHLHVTGAAASVLQSMPVETVTCALPAGGGPVIALSGRFMGRGDDELGDILMRSFCHTIGEIHPLPACIILFNGGVHLATADSPVLEDLLQLEARGARILVCGTCAGFFGIKDRLRVGEVSNMYDIAEAMTGASRLINL